jgi:arylsulfatase A
MTANAVPSSVRPTKTVRIALCLVVGTVAATATAAPDGARPNVIFILSDDEGTVDANCYGATDLETPTIDALAARGVRFTQFYAGAPICSPSRAALLTGRYPQRAGVPGNVSSMKGDAGMPTEQVTIAEVFKAAGYRTGHVGKWHLGYTKETMPNGQGFDASFGHMGGCIDNYSHFFYWRGPNRHDLWRDGTEIWEEGTHFSDLIERESIRFIEANKSEPFLLYIAWNLPHYPLQGKARWRKHYEDLPAPRRMYAAALSTMDETLGRIIDRVDALGLRDRTIIAFMSDHGHSTEERTFFGGGSAGPYRGAKFSLFEGGIRVPAIVSWPGHLPEGKVRDQLATACDWLPTLAALCKVPPPEPPIDGRTLEPVIRDAQAPSPHEVFHWQLGKQWAVRRGDWKLIVNARDTNGKPVGADERLFLANLARDKTERTNFAKERPDEVRALRELHEQWAATVDAERAKSPE